MSMEQAILEHAGALRELAAAIRERNVPLAALAGQAEQAVKEIKDSILSDKAAELAEARTERVAATKEAAAQDAKANEKQAAEVDPQMTRAIPREELQAALEAAKKNAELSKAVEQIEQAALEYKKDVYPVLLQVSKTKGKEALRGLLDKFGAKTGDSLKADQFAAIVADGNALLAG